MKQLVADKKLGAKTGGSGFYENGEPQVGGEGTDANGEEVAELLALKSFVEACLILEEGVCTVREIDLGLMAGAGSTLAAAAAAAVPEGGRDGTRPVLERLEARRRPTTTASRRRPRSGAWSPRAPRREVRPGLLRLPPGRRGRAGRDGQARDPRRRRDRVAGQRPGQLDLPGRHPDLKTVWEKAKAANARALVVASSSPVVFSAGADIKAFTQMDEATGGS